MLKIEHTEVLGWEHAIRGMRNPMNSWEKSDIEKLLDRPVWTHELASETLWAQIKDKAKPDFLKIIES